ncbi:unnamed protein product [Mytilus edulis]|uniref:Uncharacterized protein n=1 Tax=Mytilus edulis TaxID=6550 RepID=A0A8S3T4E6_MYTED|nr:unnamed protein product [Mytilus edulis]
MSDQNSLGKYLVNLPPEISSDDEEYMLANIGLFELQPVEMIDTEIELFPEQIIPPSEPELAEETIQPGPSTDLQTLESVLPSCPKRFKKISISLNRQKTTQNGESNCFRYTQNDGCNWTFTPTKHKDIIELEDLRLISTYVFSNTEDAVLLRLKVWYCLAIHFVSRGLEFHHQLNLNSFDFKIDADGDEYVMVNHETTQKNIQGGVSSEEAPSDKFMYSNVAEKRFCPLSALKELIAKTDPNAKSLFNRIVKDLDVSSGASVWYTTQALAKRTYSGLMSDICKNAKCSKVYTAHCLRATAIQCMNDAGHELRHIMPFIPVIDSDVNKNKLNRHKTSITEGTIQNFTNIDIGKLHKRQICLLPTKLYSDHKKRSDRVAKIRKKRTQQKRKKHSKTESLTDRQKVSTKLSLINIFLSIKLKSYMNIGYLVDILKCFIDYSSLELPFPRDDVVGYDDVIVVCDGYFIHCLNDRRHPKTHYVTEGAILEIDCDGVKIHQQYTQYTFIEGQLINRQQQKSLRAQICSVSLLHGVSSKFANQCFNSHSNLISIVPSFVRSKNFQTDRHQLKIEKCQTFTCKVKGFIPLGDQHFPHSVKAVDGSIVQTDIIEGNVNFTNLMVGDHIQSTTMSGMSNEYLNDNCIDYELLTLTHSEVETMAFGQVTTVENCKIEFQPEQIIEIELKSLGHAVAVANGNTTFPVMIAQPAHFRCHRVHFQLLKHLEYTIN